ncbi:response regulator [Coxiella burnetii]|uniref:response regulator n=1 Tax=Coxiella burnetii TaxID=777 RepID=UPI000163A553|nr:response regulator [Coxiella burnetii]AIT62903.1 Sensor protein [Coxiella burnetii str. Namibia]ATN85341.1 two-component system response regulator [Coxiella burnetii str. Schperling]EDR35163.1 response regulator receiver domain protein [Coxiella burnetii Q321]PHH58225.1 response regulator [Coxiella burnetii]
MITKKPIKKPLILLVEDNPFIQKIHVQLLKKLNCEVTLAIDGQSALALYSDKFDLIFLDINLSDMNGMEVCKAIRQRTSSTSIIALTSESSKNKPRYFSTGINDFIKKPTTQAALKRVLNYWIQ